MYDGRVCIWLYVIKYYGRCKWEKGPGLAGPAESRESGDPGLCPVPTYFLRTLGGGSPQVIMRLKSSLLVLSFLLDSFSLLFSVFCLCRDVGSVEVGRQHAIRPWYFWNSVWGNAAEGAGSCRNLKKSVSNCLG